MNLHAVAVPCVGAVNPLQLVTIKANRGYSTAADGSRSPVLIEVAQIQAQIQALQYNDILQLDGLNIQGLRRAIYLYGNWQGLVRQDSKGGDLIIFPDGSIWLVAMVLETFGHGLHGNDGWCKVAVTLQDP